MTRNAEQQAEFDRALQALAGEEELTGAQEDVLSVLEGADVEAVRQTWARLPAGARARLVRSLHGAAERRLKLDYGWLNHLALADEDAEVRQAGVESFLEERSPRLLARLVEMVRADPSAEVRRAVAERLAEFALLGELETLDREATAQVRGTLLAVLRDQQETPGVRSSALAALGYFSDSEVMEELGAAFPKSELRLGAVRGMGRSADPRWTDRLMPVLGSEDPEQREEAARALGEIEDERAVGPLTELVDDPERDVRLAAIWALGEIGGEEAREALLYLLEDSDDRVREAAERAISDIEFYEDPTGL